MWKRRGNTCGYSDCKKRIPDGEFLCANHYQDWVEGLIDRCPKCSRFKDIQYRVCLDCYVGRPVAPWEPAAKIPTPKRSHKVEYSEAWIDGHLRPDRFFVYILELNDGGYYVGHTSDLRKEISEHRAQKVFSTAGRNPKLQYVQLIATKRAAELHEGELKRLIESNPGQIHLMISDFHGRMRELGLE